MSFNTIINSSKIYVHFDGKLILFDDENHIINYLMLQNYLPLKRFTMLFFKEKKYVKKYIAISKTTLYLSLSFHRVRIKNGPGFLPRPTFIFSR